MPVIRVTLIEGYDEAVRDRLMEGYSAVTRTVLEAIPDGITTIVDEVKASNYRRGNQRKSPKPLPPAPEQIVLDFLAAMERRDLDAASAYLADGFTMVFPGGATFRRLEDLIAWSKLRYRKIAKAYERFDTVPGMDAATVYCSGYLYGEWPDGQSFDGIRFIDRFTVRGGRILDQAVWNDLDAAMRDGAHD